MGFLIHKEERDIFIVSWVDCVCLMCPKDIIISDTSDGHHLSSYKLEKVPRHNIIEAHRSLSGAEYSGPNRLSTADLVE